MYATEGYFLPLFFLASFRKLSSPMVMEGMPGDGASRSSRSPASRTAWAVLAPKHPIWISPCSKFGKFSKGDFTFLRDWKKSTYHTQKGSSGAKLLLTVRYMIPCVKVIFEFSRIDMVSSLRISEVIYRNFSSWCCLARGLNREIFPSG